MRFYVMDMRKIMDYSPFADDQHHELLSIKDPFTSLSLTKLLEKEIDDILMVNAQYGIPILLEGRRPKDSSQQV